MNDVKQIEIPLSKVKIIVMLIGCFLFVVIGFCFIINPTKFESLIMKSPTIIFISGVLSIIFFGFIGYFLIRKLSDKSPGLIITEKGITDNSGGLNVGFIPWSDVVAIKETQVVSQKFINVIVKNPEVYINRQKSSFKRKAMQKNYNLFGTAIGISANSLKCNYSELKNILENKFSEFLM